MYALLCIQKTQRANVATGVYVNTYIYIYMYIPVYSCMHCYI